MRNDAEELVLVAGVQDAAERRRLTAAAGDTPLRFAADQEALRRLAPQATALLADPPADVLASAARLRWLHSWAAGPVVHAGALAPRAVMTSSKGNGAVPLAEHALLLMLMLSRNATAWLDAQREHRWERHVHGELAGATCGLIGLGNSGRDLARKAAAMHMRVVGLRRGVPEPVPYVDRVYAREQLPALLAESDFVVITAPLTDETRGMLGRAEFAAMRATAFLVCVSRGGIADEEALGEALRAGTIAGAGLDAHAEEPLPPGSEVWRWPHTVVTPHNGATTAATRRRGIDIAADNLDRFVRGVPLRNTVDVTAGY